MGLFFVYPATCKICGWDGNENTVIEHCKKAHPGMLERAKELSKEHEAGDLSLSDIEKILKKEFGELR